MYFKPVEKYPDFYYGPEVCPNCGRKELQGNETASWRP